MKLSNFLTILRLVLIIPIMYFLFSDFRFAKTCAFFTYILALITDYLDGEIAMKNHEISNFGRFFDPLVDKILTMSIFVSFAALKIISAWIVIIIICREFVIACLALLIESKKYTIEFSKGGNFKCITQIVVVLLILLLFSLKDLVGFLNYPVNEKMQFYFILTINILAWIAMILTVISGYFFLIRNNFKELIKDA